MAELKTRPNDSSVIDFLNGVADEQQRADSFELVELFKKALKEEPKMWGTAIIGFGKQYIKYASGRALDWMVTGFSPRKGNLTLYILGGLTEQDELLNSLGKHKTGKGCLYIKRLTDIDKNVLEKLIVLSVKQTSNTGGVDGGN